MSTNPPSNPEPAQGHGPLWVFTPSRTDPRDLEFILVQRHSLLRDAVERVRESVLTANKHHLLFAGPRGSGKTHLVTLIVSRLGPDGEISDRMRLAWLNEDETCTTLLEFLLKIHAALGKRYPGEFPEEELEPAYEMKPDTALRFVSEHLLSALGGRTLVVVTENLDAVFEAMGDAGQKQLRAFIQENPRLSIVSTAQRLDETLLSRTSPFFGFFQVSHLKPLNLQQAVELLQNIARLNGSHDVVEFLATNRGRSRVRALHHLSGGNHRIYIVLSQFITRDSIDALLGPFMKMVDELTPYYQERIRWLSPTQRKIVEFLCICEETVPVKAIARRLFTTPQSVSSQLQDLREKGYVESNQRGREFLYEISEPLMRICVEVKDNQRLQPLRLLVDFLRVWYDDHELKRRLLEQKPSLSSAACAYLESAIERNNAEGNLRRKILLAELQSTFLEQLEPSMQENMRRELEDAPEEILIATKYLNDGNTDEAFDLLNESISQSSDSSLKLKFLLFRARMHAHQNNFDGEYNDYTAIIELPGLTIESVSKFLTTRGIRRQETGDREGAEEDFTKAINFFDEPNEYISTALLARALLYANKGNILKSFNDCESLIPLYKDDPDKKFIVLNLRGALKNRSGDIRGAIADFTNAIELEGVPADRKMQSLLSRGIAYATIGDHQNEIGDFDSIIKNENSHPELKSKALLCRSMHYNDTGHPERAVIDLSELIKLKDAPPDNISTATHLRELICISNSQNPKTFLNISKTPEISLCNLLTCFHFSEGRWNEGFGSLELALHRGLDAQPAYYTASAGIVGTVFSAGLPPEGRLAKIATLLQIYSKYRALPVLGEGAVRHIGQVFRTGEPFPSTDNLEGWASAWEQASEQFPDFRLSLRVLRTGVEYVKAGGKDQGILLSLTAPERSILRQAFGLEEESQTSAP